MLDVVLMRFSLLVCRLLPPILTRMGEATATNEVAGLDVLTFKRPRVPPWRLRA